MLEVRIIFEIMVMNESLTLLFPIVLGNVYDNYGIIVLLTPNGTKAPTLIIGKYERIWGM